MLIATINATSIASNLFGETQKVSKKTMKYIVFFLPFIAPASVIDGFILSPKFRHFFPTDVQKKLIVDTMLFDSSDIENDESVHQNVDNDDIKLLLSTNEVDEHMSKLRSKYPTSEADYLAAARKRNAARQASSERTATDDDWRQIAAEKMNAVGEIDDWDKSLSEAGNSDSQILIPLQSNLNEDGEEEEPKLMLF